MLEFLRHQTKPIMITLAGIIIIAFTFWGGYTQGDASPDATVLTMLDRDYSRVEVERLQRNFRIAQELSLRGAQDYYASELYYLKVNYADKETGGPLMVADAPVDFALNLLVVREAIEKYGIRASDDEVRQAFRSLGQFQVNGQFDRDRALEYERSLGARGLRLVDVYEVIREYIGFQKLQGLVGGNLVVNPKVVGEIYTSSHQTIKAASIPFALDDFKKSAKVTDEEISKYFEENKDGYKSPEKRAVTHVFLAKPNTDGKNAEDTVKATNEFNAKLIKLASDVIAPNADFEAEVKKAGLEVKKLPAFSMDAPPEAIKDQFPFLRAIFTNIPETRPVSDPVEVEGKGYHIFKVTKIEKPAQQELKDVKDKVRETLVEQKAQEAMQKAANDAKKKLEDSVKGGKTFEVAAKEAGLSPQILVEFSPVNPPADLSNGREIAREALSTPPGAFTKPLPTPNGVILVYVIAKELRKREDSATTKGNIAKSIESGTQGDIFRAWFERRYQEAEINADKLLRFALSAR